MIQPQSFITRVREHSTLSPQALLVAVTISELRYQKRLKPHEPLALTGAALARHCHMSERTLDRYLGECLTAGWIVGRLVYRDHRQAPTEYFLADPTDPAGCRRLHAALGVDNGPNGQTSTSLQRAGVAGISRRRLHSVVRSNNSGEEPAPPQGGRRASQQDVHEPAPEPACPPPVGGTPPDPFDDQPHDLERHELELLVRLWDLPPAVVAEEPQERSEEGTHSEPDQVQSSDAREILDRLEASLAPDPIGDYVQATRATLREQTELLRNQAEPDMHPTIARALARARAERTGSPSPELHRCPACGAPPGRPCHRPTGYHPERKALSRLDQAHDRGYQPLGASR